MYAISEVPQPVIDLFAKLKEATAEVLAEARFSEEETLIPATEDFFAKSGNKGTIYLLREGNVLWRQEETNVFVIEEGDLFGLPEFFGVAAGKYALEFAVRCTAIPAAEFIAAVCRTQKGQELWSRLLSYQFAAMAGFALSRTTGEKNLSPCMQAYDANQIIIEQGSIGNTVYSLVEGRAEVRVDGVKVSEIGEDEIFGIFAAITGNPRAATIVATQPSLVLEIEKERFLDLIQTKPSTVCKMIEDLARIICDLDKKVIALSGGPSTGTKT